jgi:hypothetical protein
MKSSTHFSGLNALALATVVAALALPAAATAGSSSDVFTRAVARQAAAPDAFERAVARKTAAPDAFERAVARKTAAPDASDVVSRYVANVLRSSPAASVQQTTLASSSGFDWSVALIGAGGALAIVLLLSATGLAVVRHRHSHLKSA